MHGSRKPWYIRTGLETCHKYAIVWFLEPEASIPLWGNDAFPPLFQIPPVSENFVVLHAEFPQFDLFPEIFRFSSAKISDDLFFFFSHSPQISNFPLFFLFQFISLLFLEISLSPPTFAKVSPWFRKIYVFLYTLRVFSPYFYHDAFIHHTMHVLDAPARNLENVWCPINVGTSLRVTRCWMEVEVQSWWRGQGSP